MTPTTFRALRRHLTLSQEFIADFLGMSAAAVCQYERGRKYAPPSHRMFPAWNKMVQTVGLWGCQP